MSKLLKIIFILLLTVLVGLVTYILIPAYSPFSPLGLTLSPPDSVSTEKDYLILGFAPYWNLKKLSSESLDAVTHFAYFALHLDASGGLYTHVNRREQDPGYTNYRRLLTTPLSGKPLILTFMPESQKALESILSSSSNRSRAVNTIISAVSESNATGVNVDFEPVGSSPESLRAPFTKFVTELNTRLDKMGSPAKHLSVSAYASAASRARIWDLAALNPEIDYLVMMSYDYTLPGDAKTGPNSPLRGAGSIFTHDILTNLAQITALIPSRKVLLGIPFYGYEWDVADATKYAPAEGRGSVASLERINELIAANTLELLWDRNSLTPYAVRREEGKIVSQIYYENVSSIKLKLDLVQQAGLGGIAIWALGYEGNDPLLWQVISSELSH